MNERMKFKKAGEDTQPVRQVSGGGVRQEGEHDTMEETIRRAVGRGIPRDLEMQMTEQLRQFRARLEKHPYVLRMEHGRWWFFGRIFCLKGGLALSAAVLLAAVGIVAVMSTGTGTFPASYYSVQAGRGIGPVALGMTKKQVDSHWGSADLAANGSASYYRHGVQVGLTTEGNVGQMTCHIAQGAPGPFESFRGYTPEGIAMGALEDDVVKTYGIPDQRVEVTVPGRQGEATRGVSLGYNRGVRFVVQSGLVSTWGESGRVSRMVVAPANSLVKQMVSVYRRGSLGLYGDLWRS